MHSASDSIVSSGSDLWKNYNRGESFIFLNSSLLISYVLRLASENHFSIDQNQNENQVTGTEKLQRKRQSCLSWKMLTVKSNYLIKNSPKSSARWPEPFIQQAYQMQCSTPKRCAISCTNNLQLLCEKKPQWLQFKYKTCALLSKYS